VLKNSRPKSTPWQAADALLLLDGWAMLAHQWP